MADPIVLTKHKPMRTSHSLNASVFYKRNCTSFNYELPPNLTLIKERCQQLLLASVIGLIIFCSNASAQSIESGRKLTPIISLLLLSDTNSGATMPLEDASRFLIQATFGPTYNDISQLSNNSFEGWLNTQFNMPITTTVGFTESQNWVSNYPLIISGSANSSLLNVMLNARDQLRQRMAYALSQIFVVSRDVSNGIDERPLYYLDYYDMLLKNGFGNYRDLLEKVTKNNVMGFYLTMRLNAPADTQVGPVLHPSSFYVTSPDENYAREVMQLFSVGLVKLNIDGTPVIENGQVVPSYTQETIENFARVFTGWNYQSGQTPASSSFFNLGIPSNTNPMIAFDAFHDKGAKTLLNGAILAANQSAEKDLDDALDNIFNHPNVGPFIGKLLIQHFVTSNPTPAYVERVARVFNDNGHGIRGDLKAVLTAILLDNEARNGHETLPEIFGKFKEPFIRQLALWRGLDARRKTSNNNMFSAYDDVFLRRFKQFPLRARSVFNFYQADFSPAGPISDANLVAPVSQLIDSESVVSIATTHEEYIQRHHDNAGNSFATSSTNLLFDTGPLQTLVPNNLLNPEDLIERLNLILLGGAMTDEMRQILLDVHDPSLYLVEDKWEVVIDLANIIMVSPQFMIQR
jgi:uncharacterized protein (DUF1800 family)